MTEHEPTDDDEILDEYDLEGGVRGKFAERYAGGTNLSQLDPDAPEVFAEPEAANRVLGESADQPRNSAP